MIKVNLLFLRQARVKKTNSIQHKQTNQVAEGNFQRTKHEKKIIQETKKNDAEKK